jgi:hypothetical protein
MVKIVRAGMTDKERWALCGCNLLGLGWNAALPAKIFLLRNFIGI